MKKVVIIGAGRIFNKHFEALNHNKKYFKIVGIFDIDPKKNNIIKCDFLTIDHDIFSGKNVLSIGNPPFGRNSSMALKFIKKSALFATTIAFILPKGFKKDPLSIKYH